MAVRFTSCSMHTVDSKGRVFIPQHYRDLLGEKFVISLSIGMRTPAFYTVEAWEERCRLFDRASQTDQNEYLISFLVNGSTFEDYSCDAQGRVLIPQALRERYSLKEGQDVMLVGTGSTLELWNSEKFNKQMELLYGNGEFPNENVDRLLKYIENKYSAVQTASEDK